MKHGANIYKYAKKLQCKPAEIVDFSSNINSYHPDIHIQPTQSIIVQYAESSYKALKKTIAKRHTINSSQIALFNGATAAIYALLETLEYKRVYLYAPLYGEYEKALHQDAKIIKINRFENIYKKPKYGSTIIFVNPFTPDGKYYNLDQLFTLWREQACTIIVDESFLEFEGRNSLREKIKSYKKLYIIQSFSKFYSCAGIRVGAIFSNKKNIQNLKIPLWNISSFDAEFLQSRLSDKKFEKRSKKLYKKEKKVLFKILKKSELFEKVYQSNANFFMVKSKEAQKLFKYLLKQKILVRTCQSFDYLDENYLRFALKEKSAHKRLKKTLRSYR